MNNQKLEIKDNDCIAKLIEGKGYAMHIVKPRITGNKNNSK